MAWAGSCGNNVEVIRNAQAGSFGDAA